MSRSWKTTLIAALVVLSACAAGFSGEEVNKHREENLTSYVFHFGGGVGDKAVTPEWIREFVEDYIVPRFPTGTTVQEGRGQWQNPDSGEIVRERSDVLALECYPNNASKKLMEEIATEYVKQNTEANASCFIKIYPSVTTELYYSND